MTYKRREGNPCFGFVTLDIGNRTQGYFYNGLNNYRNPPKKKGCHYLYHHQGEEDDDDDGTLRCPFVKKGHGQKFPLFKQHKSLLEKYNEDGEKGSREGRQEIPIEYCMTFVKYNFYSSKVRMKEGYMSSKNKGTQAIILNNNNNTYNNTQNKRTEKLERTGSLRDHDFIYVFSSFMYSAEREQNSVSNQHKFQNTNTRETYITTT